MEANLSWAALAILCPILMLAPGAWIAFTVFDRSLAYPLKVALAIAFSPFVVGIEVLVLTRLGLSFAVVAPLTLLNVAALALMRPRPPAQDAIAAPSLWAVAACAGVIAATLLAGWLIEPGLRIYAWHNMMQANPVYEIARLPDPIEEWDLAGYAVHYAWLGHAQIAVIAKLAGLSPFYVHPIANIISLFPTVAFLGAAVLRFQPARPVGAVLAATAAFLSTNLLGVLYAFTKGVDYEGEPRLCAIIYKYINFDVMTYGVALTAAATAMLIAATQAPAARLRWLLGASLCAIGVAVIYPLMFPVLFVLLGAAAVSPKLIDLLQTRRLPLERGDAYAAAALAATFAVFWFGTQALTGGEAGGLVEVASVGKMVQWVKFGIKAAGLWAPFVILGALHAWRDRDPARTMLLMTAAVAGAAFLVLILPSHDEYKFMYVGLFVLTPLIADEALRLFNRLPRLGAWAAGAATIAMVALVFTHIARDHWPWFGVADSPELREDRFVVEPAAPELAWTIAVRDQTPPDTVIVYPPTRMPHSLFAQRPSYMPVDVGSPYRYGHLIPVIETLEEIKGLPRDVINARTQLVTSLYAKGGATDYPAALAELRKMQRPVAVAGDPGNGFIAWLNEQGVGSRLYADRYAVVQLIDGAGGATDGGGRP